MRTVYDVVDKDGYLFVTGLASRTSAEGQRVWCSGHYPQKAPHAVVPRQVAGPEDTDELLRLRADLRDLLLSLANEPVSDPVRGFADDLRARHGFGGES